MKKNAQNRSELRQFEYFDPKIQNSEPKLALPLSLRSDRVPGFTICQLLEKHWFILTENPLSQKIPRQRNGRQYLP